MSVVDDDFEQQTSDMAAMARHRKKEIADAMRLGVTVPVTDLVALNKLEIQIAQRKQFARLREMTREPVEEEVVDA